MGIENINGATGSYDVNIKNSSVKYGRNSIANYFKYIESYKSNTLTADALDFSNSKEMLNGEFATKIDEANKALKTPQVNVKFNLIYMPEPKGLNKLFAKIKNLFGNKNDQPNPINLNRMALLGAAYEELGRKVSVSVQELSQKLQEAFGQKFDAKFLDRNNDNEIDIAEYSVSILMADMLSKDQTALKPENITGEITNDGENASLAYANDKNYTAAIRDAESIYNSLNLSEAKSKFIAKENNLAQ